MEKMEVKSLQVSGGGEPLFHKEIERIFDLIKGRVFSLNTFTTNGLLLNERLCDKLINITKKQITISLNFSNEKDYKRFHNTREKNFYRTLENIKCLVENKREKGVKNPKIALQLFVWDGAFGKLTYNTEMAYNLNVDILVFNPIFMYNNLSINIREKCKDFLKEVEEVLRKDEKELISSLLTPYPEINEEISKIRREKFPSKYKEWNVKEENFCSFEAICPFPWFLMHVKANGNVYPCCALLRPDFSPFGNAKENSLKYLWNSKNYSSFRKLFKTWLEKQRLYPYDYSLVPLPVQCMAQRACIMKTLPFLDDREFFKEMDSLCKKGAKLEEIKKRSRVYYFLKKLMRKIWD